MKLMEKLKKTKCNMCLLGERELSSKCLAVNITTMLQILAR